MNKRIVIVDDSLSAIAAIVAALGEERRGEIETFLDPRAAVAYLADNAIDLLMVDHTMPYLTGVELIRLVRAQSLHADTPILMITSDNNRKTRLDAIEAGATDFLAKPFDTTELWARVRNLMRLGLAQRELRDKAETLEADVDEALVCIRSREEEIIWRLARAMACRDGDTGEHIDRVAGIARIIADELGFSSEQCDMIHLATPLHDIGKIGVSDAILLKPGRLSTDEIGQMRAHVQIGVDILAGSDSALIKTAERIVSGHHEKWDGTGYPKGLKQDAIPMEARIVAVADVFDALCSERPYKRAWPLEEARAEILKGSGSHFDPACVAAFEARWQDIVTLTAA